MSGASRRIAVTTGGAHVPGLDAVIAGVTRAAHELGWTVVGIRDGYEGLLFPERYPMGGVMPLTLDVVEGRAIGALLGASRLDPLRVQALTPDGQADEVDRSGDVLEALRREQVDGVVAIVGSKTIGLALKLDRRGVKSVCVPKSIENELAVTDRTVGFHSALASCTELLDRVRDEARGTRRLGVVEVPGDLVGWLALHSGLAACADAVLIPEVPFDLDKVATHLGRGGRSRGGPSLVVAAEGARPAGGQSLTRDAAPHRERLRRALSLGSSGDDTDDGRQVIEKAGLVGKAISLALRERCGCRTFAVTAAHMLRGGPPSVTDRQLGLAYGAAAVRGVHGAKTGTITAIQSSRVAYVPLVEAVNQVRRVRPDSEVLVAARALGIALGD